MLILFTFSKKSVDDGLTTLDGRQRQNIATEAYKQR